jgi:hypothetical protein
MHVLFQKEWAQKDRINFVSKNKDEQDNGLQ